MAGGKMLITDNEINARIQNNKEEIKTSGNDKGILSRWWNDDEPEETTKGYVLGRFVEILMVHFKDKFTHLKIK